MLLTACSKLVENLGQAVRTQLVDGLLADLLQDARFLHVKTHKLLQVCKQVVPNLFTSCQQVVFALFSTNYVTSSQQVVPNLLTTCDKHCEDNLLTTCSQTCYKMRDFCVCTKIPISRTILLIIQYNTIQYNTIQYNTIQYNTIQFI